MSSSVPKDCPKVGTPNREPCGPALPPAPALPRRFPTLDLRAIARSTRSSHSPACRSEPQERDISLECYALSSTSWQSPCCLHMTRSAGSSPTAGRWSRQSEGLSALGWTTPIVNLSSGSPGTPTEPLPVGNGSVGIDFPYGYLPTNRRAVGDRIAHASAAHCSIAHIFETRAISRLGITHEPLRLRLRRTLRVRHGDREAEVAACCRLP